MVLFIGSWMAPAAEAALLLRAGGAALYDTETDLTWAADASLGGRDSFVPSQSTLASLEIAGVSGWRLPNMDVDGDGSVCGTCADNEPGYLYGAYGITSGAPFPFTNVEDHYWSGNQQSGFAYYVFLFSSGTVSVKNIQTQLAWAWPVQSGDVFGRDRVEASFTLLSDGSTPVAVSADGQVVAGTTTAPCCEAFRWNAGTGFLGLGDLPGGGDVSYGRAASADGTYVVGSGRLPPPNQDEAYRWDAGSGLVGLGFVPGGTDNSSALDISGDGTKVVGFSSLPLSGQGSFQNVAFLWTEPGPMVSLGDLAGGAIRSIANAISTDGTTVVGRGEDASGDGEIIVGRGYDGSFAATVWDERNGMRKLEDLLVAAGVDLDGWAPEWALSISADGQTIAGLASKNGDDMSFVAVLPRPDVIDFETATPGTPIPPDSL